uniref:Uncharacterized protein n=1 Tax=Anser brachyrhynchus TaxID=132585 RepID=A0A8B9I2N2_9AVES
MVSLTDDKDKCCYNLISKNIFFSSVNISTIFGLLILGSRSASCAQVLAFNIINTWEGLTPSFTIIYSKRLGTLQEGNFKGSGAVCPHIQRDELAQNKNCLAEQRAVAGAQKEKEGL